MQNVDNTIKTAITIGKFDGIHLGHQLLIDRLMSYKKSGMRALAIMIESGKPGILTKEEGDLFCKEKGIDEVVHLSFSDELRRMSPERFIEKILMERFFAGAVVVGTDFHFGYERSGSIEDLQAGASKGHFQFEAVKKLEIDGKVVSSTGIREALARGDMDHVNRCLGYTYFVNGEILHGKHLGSTIGFPTINILPDQRSKLLPLYGVYETEIFIDGAAYRGVTNVGIRPTVQDGENVSVETHILDFHQDVYGKQAKVCFKRFIREEKKFESLDELISQLNRDIQSI